ncbi:hypothetical protein JD844_031032 [Phrynosoma platyrhinos]|uniref:Coiled-coil SMC6 And NSE5 INteracting (CANIN) domain-containing protein n=1 Tax=Phrynosoma platyrhinos TaxID=52577 RepID=A0ABQ7T0P7_PHRPL|nr:hypothetical protein JD844_031032 [Phrynosoma platyrhinos]
METEGQDLPSQETSLVPLPPKTSYSKEMFNTWRDIRWFQIPLSSLRKPKAGLFSFTFQSSLQRYQQLRKTKRLKNDNRRCLRAGKAGGRKSHSSHRKGYQASRNMNMRLQKCRSSTSFLLKRYIFHPRIPQEQGKEPDCCSSKKLREINLGSDEEDLALEVHSLPCVPPSACPTAEAAGSSDSELQIWDGARSPLEDDDRFPPDWTPPRIEFLNNEVPPSLSPAPRPASRSQSWEEMPDITQGSSELQMEIATQASTPAANIFPSLQESIDMQLKEPESGEMLSPDHPLSSSCQMVNEEQEGGTVTLEEQTQADHERAFDQEEPSPIHPLSIVHFRSSISTISNEFSERLTCESDLEGESLTLSRMSSTCIISASMDELSDDPGRLTQDSDMEEDTDDDGLLSLEELLWTNDTKPSSEEPNTMVTRCVEQTQKNEELERSLGAKLPLSSSLSSTEVAKESEEDGALFPEAHRLFLEQFPINRDTIPTLHPGESIFWFPPYARTTLLLDTTGLEPQNQIERLFFR